MPYDSLVMAAIAHDIATTLVGDRVAAIHQPDPLTLIAAFSRRQRILLSAHPEYARVHLASHDVPHPLQPPAFCMLLRKHLEGARLRNVRQVDFDRILEFDFQRGEELWTLVVENMGRHSNIMLRDHEGVMRGVIKPVPSSVNRFRELTVGKKYLQPPSGRRLDPLTSPVEELIARLMDEPDQRISDAVSRSWVGMSPRLVNWLLETAGVKPGESAADAAPRLEPSLSVLRTIVATHAFHPSLKGLPAAQLPGGTLKGDTGKVSIDLWALPLEPQTDSGSAPADGLTKFSSGDPGGVSMSSIVERVFEARMANRELDDERARILASLKQAAAREKRKLSDFERVLDESSWADQFRLWGQALLMNPTADCEGLRELAVPNPDAAGGILSVPLDPDLTLIENAERFFSRARRSERAAAEVLGMAARSRAIIDLIEAAIVETGTADGIAAIRRVEALCRQGVEQAGGVFSSAPVAAGPNKGDSTGGGESRGAGSRAISLPPGVRRVLAQSGHEILYGRTSTDNDFLTTRVAKPNDWWLHVRGESSAHVVIRTHNQPDKVPHKTLLEAAIVAASHSRSKHSSYVPVDYTLRKYVVKRRGSPPGAVQYRSEKTLHVRPGSDDTE